MDHSDPAGAGRPFRDRADAGRQLAGAVSGLELPAGDPVVLGLPRGGVPVGAEVARALGAPLDVVFVRKLGVPWQPELAMGAVGEGGVRIVDAEIVRSARVDAAALAAVESRERDEIGRQARALRAGRPAVPLSGRPVVLVDDGLATGATMRAAAQVARSLGAAWVGVAVPVAPPSSLDRLRAAVDAVVCVVETEAFLAIGEFYDDFTQVPTERVVELLAAAAEQPGPAR